MSALGSLSPLLEGAYQFVSFTFRTLLRNQPVLSYPRLPWTRPFCSASALEKTGSGVAPRPSLLHRGADL